MHNGPQFHLSTNAKQEVVSNLPDKRTVEIIEREESLVAAA
jgi:hypothetical protein